MMNDIRKPCYYCGQPVNLYGRCAIEYRNGNNLFWHLVCYERDKAQEAAQKATAQARHQEIALMD
jgi:hypothetical protein